MALDIEGLTTQSFDRHMPIKPSLVDGARFRKPPFQRSGRNVNARAGGAHIAEHDPEMDLKMIMKDLPLEERRKIEKQRGTVLSGRAGKGSVDFITVVDEDGKKHVIIDL